MPKKERLSTKTAKILKEVTDLAEEGLTVDGGHHKQYYLGRILRLLDTERFRALQARIGEQEVTGVPP